MDEISCPDISVLQTATDEISLTLRCSTDRHGRVNLFLTLSAEKSALFFVFLCVLLYR
jgi:hypothetical protein